MLEDARVYWALSGSIAKCDLGPGLPRDRAALHPGKAPRLIFELPNNCENSPSPDAAQHALR
jgi:hypothetical protein